jgi:uncharacterized protein DUF1918
MSAPVPAHRNKKTAGPPAEATGNAVRARVGDEIVVRGTTGGVVTRDGEIVGVHHPDGSPPYDVRWSDTGHVTLYFPGPDSFVRHLSHPRGGGDVRTE